MKDFTQGNPTRQIIAFSLPMLIGNLFQQFYNMVDAIVVGRYVSGEALAAVGTSGGVLNFMLAILAGLTTGASVLISQFYGARQEGNLRRTVSTSIITLGTIGAVISVIGILIMPTLMRLLHVPADIFADAVLYMRIIMGGMIFAMTYNLFLAYLRALGDTVRPLYILILSTMLNIVLDLFFVVKLHMGVAGVAIATLISQAVAGIVTYLYVVYRVPILKVEKLIFDKILFRQFLRYSIPASVQMSLTSLANLTILRLVNSFGSVVVAGYTAAIKIDQLVMLPISNLSMAISTFCAQNMGAGSEDRAKKGLRSGNLIMVTVALTLSAVLLIINQSLIAQFVDETARNSTEIILIGGSYLSITSCFYFLFAIFFAFNGFFRGVGDAVIVMILTITSLSIRTVCAHLMVHMGGMGVEAVAWSIPIGWGLCSLFCVFYYKNRLWAGKSAVKPQPVASQ